MHTLSLCLRASAAGVGLRRSTARTCRLKKLAAKLQQVSRQLRSIHISRATSHFDVVSDYRWLWTPSNTFSNVFVTFLMFTDISRSSNGAKQAFLTILKDL